MSFLLFSFTFNASGVIHVCLLMSLALLFAAHLGEGTVPTRGSTEGVEFRADEWLVGVEDCSVSVP